MGESLWPQVVNWPGDDGRLNIFTSRARVWITIRAKLCNLFESYGFGCEQLRASLKQLSKRTIAFAIPAATVEKHAETVREYRVSTDK
jgi:hypothetical protein